MIAIDKAEKDAIRAKFPKVHIVRTMKQKSKRHHYYCEESKGVMKYLNQLRNTHSSNTMREGGNHTNRQNGKRVSA